LLISRASNEIFSSNPLPLHQQNTDEHQQG
jgi:hypothetical protein